MMFREIIRSNKNSKAIFQGKIYVDSNAQQTDGYQEIYLLDKVYLYFI